MSSTYGAVSLLFGAIVGLTGFMDFVLPKGKAVSGTAQPNDAEKAIPPNVLPLLYQVMTDRTGPGFSRAIGDIVKLDLDSRVIALDELVKLMGSDLPSIRYTAARAAAEILDGTARRDATGAYKRDIYVSLRVDLEDAVWDRHAYVRIFEIDLRYSVYMSFKEHRETVPKLGEWWIRRRATYAVEQRLQEKSR